MSKKQSIGATMDALAARYVSGRKMLPGEVTAQDYADRYSVPRSTASEHLRAMLAHGEVTARTVIIDGKRVRAYMAKGGE